MLRNESPLSQPMPLYNPAMSSPSPLNATGMMHHHHQHHLPPMPSFNFSPHDFFQAHHAMQSMSRRRFHPYQRNEPRMGCPPSPLLPPPQQQQQQPVFKTPPPPPPPRPPPPSFSPPSFSPPHVQTHPSVLSPMPPPPPPPPRPNTSVNTSSCVRDIIHSFPFSPQLTFELALPKGHVDDLLRLDKAVVVLERGKRTRSEVWHYMGRVQLVDSGLYCKGLVGCYGCKMTYLYKSKSQGTSTLRHHKCDLVFEVLKEKKKRELLKKLQDQQNQENNKKHILPSHLQLKPFQNDELIVELLQQPLPSRSFPNFSRNGMQQVPWNLKWSRK